MIDYRKSRILDPAWWRMLRTKLGCLERQTRAKGLDAALRYHLALVSNGSLTEKSFSQMQETAKERYFDLLGAWQPWEGGSYVAKKSKEFRDSRQAYIDTFGRDPLDPKFKEWEAEQIRKINAGEFDDKTPDPETLVLSRMRVKNTIKDR